jgi:hypothetical protein
MQGWLAIGLRPAVENGERGDLGQRRGPQEERGPEVGLSSARYRGDIRARRRSGSVKVIIGVDPHKSVNAVAAIDGG